MISIDWVTYVITIPQSYLTQIEGTLYELDTNQFRLDLKAIEASLEGMPHPKTHIHNTQVTVAGTTYARTVVLLAPYSITFEDGQYSVRLVGSNNNIFDIQNGILNQNYVQVIPGNSGGLITVSIGSGLTTEEHNKLMATGLESTLAAIQAKIETMADKVEILEKIAEGNWKMTENQFIVYDEDGVTEILHFELYGPEGNPSMTRVVERRGGRVE